MEDLLNKIKETIELKDKMITEQKALIESTKAETNSLKTQLRGSEAIVSELKAKLNKIEQTFKSMR